MAAATDELILLERVFLCLGSADTDEQLQAAVCKFLPPVLLKLSSPQEGVRKKVMGVLVHINRRVKSRPKVQLPVEALLLQYQDPAASSFVINFTIIYIKMGYPRMEMKKQAELVSSVLNCIEGKPLSHQDSLLLMIMSALGHIEIPPNPEKRAALLGLQDKPYVTHHLINFLLDMLLLPYGAVGQHSEDREPGQPIDWSQYPVPPGLSEYGFKRVIGDNPPSAEQLEKIKLGIVKFLAGGFFPDHFILTHLIVAAADTRFSVANLADTELKKIVPGLDWSSMQLTCALYLVFLGTTKPLGRPETPVKPEKKRVPANTRIRLKILQYLCRVTGSGFLIPSSIQVIISSIYSSNSNKKLKSLALDFALNMVKQYNLPHLTLVAGTLRTAIGKIITDFPDPEHKAKAYTIIGQLGARIPSLVNKDFSIIQKFVDALTTTDGEMRRSVRDALITMSPAFVLDPQDERAIATMTAMLSVYIESEEPSVRSTAVHYVATIFPKDHAPSRYLLLLACGDEKTEIVVQAIIALYRTAERMNERTESDFKKLVFADFLQMVDYINEKRIERLSSSVSRKFAVGSSQLPFSLKTFMQIIFYLRLCLFRAAEITLASGGPTENHPCNYTPKIARYLVKLFEESPKYFNFYLELIMPLCKMPNSEKMALVALLEIVSAGTVSATITSRFVNDLPWIKTLITSSPKSEIRELAAKIYAIVVVNNFDNSEFETQIAEFIHMIQNKTVERQEGVLLVLPLLMERKLLIRQQVDDPEMLLSWPPYVETVKTICNFLSTNDATLLEVATSDIGRIGFRFPLPLPAELPKNEGFSIKDVVESLFAILNNVKLSANIKESAVQSLGLLCVEESFPLAKFVIEKLIEFAKETKDATMHFTIGGALVHCVQKSGSLMARDSWTTLESEYEQKFSAESDMLLNFLLDELLKLALDSHPNSRQAVCIWLMTIVDQNSKRQHIKDRLALIQNVFMDFLSENNDIVQVAASKGICLVYQTCGDESSRKILVSNLLSQLTDGRRQVQQMTADTQVFEEGQLGKAPTGGNITTYKEICSLASDLNKPDLIYTFLQLANNNATWVSRTGAGFGFSALASIAKDELTNLGSSIIPKLYRYQFDPTPKIQQSMANIWNTIVPSTPKALEQYHDEILDDICRNLTNSHWRVRISACNALSNLLKSTAQIDLEKRAPELWTQLFRVMDDIHEDTRNTATNTARIFGKVCVSRCDVKHGQSGEKILQSMLPILLDVGILHSVPTIQQLSLQTITQLVTPAGILLKPFLVNLIPALIMATDGENRLLTYLSTKYSGQAEKQEAVDSARVSAAKNHYASGILKKLIQYIDAEILKELIPKIVELIKSSAGLGSKTAISYFFVLLSAEMKNELTPYAGKVLNAFMNGLSDRNVNLRKTNAVAIGYIVGSAKDSSLEKMFNTLNTWYMEREDDSMRRAIGITLQSISNQNVDIMKKYSEVVLPLIFFAMHGIKSPNGENLPTIELWTELWTEVAHGTETAILNNLPIITSKLNSALESASWNTKAQAANAISTVALRVGTTMDDNCRNTLLKVLVSGLQGRTWNGKEYLLSALSSLTCNSNKENLISDVELMTMIVDALYKESKKENIEYRRHALKAFSDVLHELKIDRFTQMYDIAEQILGKIARDNDGDDDDDNRRNNSSDDEDDKINQTSEEIIKKRDNKIKLQETVYEALGKAWPSSPNSKETQDKYCLQIVKHCCKTLPKSTRTIQVAIMTTLTLFVEKLAFLRMKFDDLTQDDKDKLDNVCKSLYQILTTSVNIPKCTRIRKEALNIVLVMGKKLIECENSNEIDGLKNLFYQLLPELTQDHQPEIRTRVVDIKSILQIQS